MKLPVEPHVAQRARWPQQGEHVLAQHNAHSVIVYQAYRPSIGHWAATHGHLGGPDFSLSRMSWIKPNFLWMMHRSGWGMKAGQEVVLALRLRRAFFESLLDAAVPSTYNPARYADRDTWQAAVAGSDVRLQWDPDHAPSGLRVARRALQLGLRGEALATLARDALLEVLDVSDFVAAQRPHAQDDNPHLLTPVEHVFAPLSPPTP